MSGQVHYYAGYEIYNDSATEFTVKCPDDTRTDYPTLVEAKDALRIMLKARIEELRDQIDRLDNELVGDTMYKLG